MTTPLPELGAPGVYLAPDVVHAPPAGVRMDVCAFAGLTERGPAWQPLDDPALDRSAPAAGRARSVAVPVQSWSEFEDLFGGHSAPGLLGRAVAAFFAQGGRRAYVVRIVPRMPLPAPEPPACARLALGPVHVRARDEGSWGNSLSVRLSFDARVVPLSSVDPLPAGLVVPAGSVLRLRDRSEAVSLHFVTSVGRRLAAHRRAWERFVVLDRPFVGEIAQAEIVSGSLDVSDGRGRTEHFTELGLQDDHPRWVGAVLAAESRLLALPGDVTVIVPDPGLGQWESTRDVHGVDRHAQVTPEDFFGVESVDAAPAGLEALRDLDDCSSLCVPDLYSPEERPETSDVSTPTTFAGAEFELCVPVRGVPAAVPPRVELPGLRLDPALPSERQRIISLQDRVIRVAERFALVALLDVPPGLRPHDVLAWRSAFDSSYAAAYQGWPRVPLGSGLVRVPPSAFAAGVLASVPITTGPALVALTGAVAVLDGQTDPAVIHTLHRAGVNLTVRDRAALRFTAGRTLAVDPAWHQLTARRIVTQLERALATHLAWATFEPNGSSLRERVRVAVEHLVGEVFAPDAFFVRLPDAGETTVLCEVGVAPSAPLEFLVVRVLRADDRTVVTA